MDRLDRVMGPAGWERRHPHVEKTTTCELTLILPDGTRVTKTDGAGDTDVEAEKGSLSDSFKRAAVNWGIGRYLYGLASPWVEIEPAGRSYKIKASELPKLRAVLAKGYRSPQDAGDPPPEAKLNLAVTAAMTAITVCETLAELKAWREKNDAMLREMRVSDRNLIALHFKAREGALTPRPEDDPFRQSTTSSVSGRDSHLQNGAVQ